MKSVRTESSIADSLLIKLFDQSGNKNGGNKGFCLFLINGDGNPSCISNYSDAATKLAIASVINRYKLMLDSMEDYEDASDLEIDDDDDDDDDIEE